ADIRDVPIERLKTMLQEAAVDGVIDDDLIAGTTCTIEKEVAVWKLVDIPVRRGTPYGRIQVCRSKEGRVIRMVGLERLPQGWDVAPLICAPTRGAQPVQREWWQP